MQDNMSAEATGRSEVDLMSIIDSIGPTSSSDSGDSSTAQPKTTVLPPTPGTPLDVSSMLGQLGVEFPEARQPGPVTPERRSQLSKDNIARMAVEAGAAGIGPGDMLFAGLGGGADRKTDVDPAALRTALVQDAATDAFGGTIGSIVGGMMESGAAMQKLPSQLANMATRWFTGGKDVFETFDEGTARLLAGGYTSSEALDDSTSENRSRFVPADMSPEEFAAAIGESSPFAKAVGSAFGDVGFMLAATVLGGGVGGATAAPRAAGTLGKLWAPVRAFVANPGGQMYLGAMGGRSAVGMSSGYDRYLDNKNKFVASMNAAYDDLGLQYEKLTPEEYSRGIDMGTSIASGIGTIALEAVSSGLGTALGGRRVMNRLMFGKADKVVADGFLPMFRGAGASLAASGSAEGSEEFLEVYKDAFLRGVWSPYEDGRFLRTFDFADIGKTFKQHAPEAFTSFAIGFIAGAPLGGLGGLARTKRRSQVTQAFQSALAEDQALREDGDPASVAAATAVARYIAEGEMQGSSDPAIRKLVIDHLKRTTLQEVGQVTEEQLNDPEWVASFVQRNPMLAVAMAQDIDELSRRNMEWLTGPASEGRVPSRAARAKFGNLLRQQVNEFVPVYMRGWAVRATEEVAVLERELQEASRVPGEEGLARRMAAAQRLGHIRRVRRLWDQAMVEGLMPSESEFAEWTGLDAELGKIDEDGTADATEDSPATVENESSIPQEREPDPPRGGDVAPGIVAAANRSLARKAKDPRLLRRLARRGVAEAAMRLSEMHATGENGVEVHAAKSEHWLNVAMSLVEDSDALMYMGRFHERNARAARREKSRAYEMARAKWYYRRAANQGSMEANVRMGEIALERGETDTAREQFRLGGVYRPEVEVPSGDARVPLEAPAVQPAPEAAPEAGTPQAAPETPPQARTPKGSSAIDEAPAEVRNEDIYEEMQEDMSRREQARQEREAQQAADEDAATAERLTGEVRAAAANDNLQVRLVKTEGSRARQKVAAALSKLGKRVQFVRILEDIPQEPSLRNPTGRRRRVASGFRGFVSSDPDVVYVVVLPEAMTNESDLVYEYLQAALHETAHGLVQDPEIRAEVEKVISAELTAEFARRFDLGTSPEERREEELVYTLTQGLIRSSGVDSLLLPEDMAGKVAAALKQVFNRIKFMLPGQQRKALLNRIIKDRIASKKKAKEVSKDNPAREVMGQARAATPKPQAEPKKTGGDQQGTLFMRERTSPQDRQRIAELAETIDLFDERGYGTLSHPVDGNDVDAEAIIGDLLAYSAKVPRKYLKGTEEFEYLASAIHRVLIEKSADSTDYERAAAVMSNALGEGIADYDQIVVAARRMGWEGTDKQVPFDIVSEEDVDPRRLMELMDDPDGFADSGPRFMRELTGQEAEAAKLRTRVAELRIKSMGATPELRERISREIDSIRREFEERIGPWDTKLPYESEIEADNARYRREQQRKLDLRANRRRQRDASAVKRHQKAHERGDTKTGKRLADEAAESRGYIVAARHGTNSQFNVFEAGEFGFHFGNASAAEQRGESKDYYLRLATPMRVKDMGYFDPMNFLVGRGPDVSKARAEVQRLREKHADDLESTDSFRQRRAEYLVSAPAREFLKRQGYDGLVYRNEAEGFGDSYVVFDADQIKSADPFTYDDQGQLVPLDKRFDDSTGDIRFMREREGSEPAPTERVEAIANEYSPGLAKFATAMVWEYHILDREVKRLMEMYNIPEEMRASDEYKVGPGYYHEFMRQFATQEMRPFEDAVKALAKKLKVSRQDVISMVTEYTYVTQIPERAEALRRKNAARIEGKIDQARRDVGFLDEADIDEIIQRETAIGMSEEDAAKRQAEIEQQFSGEPMFMDLVQRIRAMNRKTLEIRRDEGLITQAVFDDMVERYPNYVPIVTSVLNETNQQEEMRQRTPGTAKLALRRNVGGQIADAKDLPKFWMMAWSLTTLDRTTAAHEASRNRGHNALHRLAMSGMTGLVETASLEDARADAGRLERIRIAAQEKRTGEQLSDEAKEQRVGGAKRDAETNLRDGVRGGVPKVLQLKLDRDMDLTDDAVLEEIRSVRESEDGLTASERARNRELASEAVQAREYLNSDEGRNELAALQSEALEIRREEAMYRRDFGIKRGDEVPAELQEIRDRLKKVNDRISSLKNREKSVLRRVVKPRDESARAARLKELEKGRRKRKKGEVVYVKINDDTLANAMLVRRRGWATALMQSDNRLMSTLARNYMRVMNFLRFAYVSASFGFLKGEALRSPVQAVAMARVAADERLEPEVAERFLEILDKNLGFKYFTSTTPGIAVRGAIRALPFRSRWRSFRHLMRGGEPRNETERIYAQAMEDGVLMGGLYTLENYDTAVAKAKRQVQVMTEPGIAGRVRSARASEFIVDKTRGANDWVDVLSGGLDFVNRMLVYESAIEAGIDRKTAAVMARDATVDFAAKGTVSKQVNQFYLFFSPRMQGIYQLIRAFKASKPEGATKTDVAMQFITGKGKSNTVPILRQLFLWSFAAAILRELLFEDDEDPETKTSKFAGLQSILIPVWYSDDGTYQSFELNNPYGFGAVARLGQRMADFLMGDTTPLEMLGGVTSDFATELFPLTITGTNQGAVQLVPTIAQPLVSAIYNVDWKGGPVYPDGAVFGAGDKRESQMYWADASGFSIVTASLLSDVTGFVARMVGSANTRGVEISPSQLDYIISRYAPGIARDAYAALSMSWRGLPTTTDRAPFLNAFLTQSGGQTVIPGMFRDMEGLRADMKEDKKLYGEAEARRRYGREFNFFENAKFRSRYLPNSEQGLSFDSSVYQIRKLKNTRNEFLKAGEYDKAKRVQEQIVQAQGAILGSALRFRNRDGGGLDDWLQDNVLKRIGGGNR